MPSSPARLLVAPVAVPAGLDAAAVAARLVTAGLPLVGAFSGDWAGGGELVVAEPARTVAPTEAAAAFAVPDLQPEVDAAGAPAGAVGGGWFGYLGFGLSHALRRRTTAVPPARLLPVASWAWHDWVLRRPAGGPWRFEALVGPAFDGPAALAVRARLEGLLQGRPEEGDVGDVGVPVLAAPERVAHAIAVEECVRAIRRGDVYQANITGGLDLELDGRPVDAWARLVRGLRPARAALISVADGAVVGASPELFLARRAGHVVTAPIKGTRPLAGTAEDEVLRGSAKDAAENVMIVDLMRNDLSAVCRPGTVAVSGLLDVAAHAGVWHLVSRVEGELPAGTPHARLLAATFPPGSVTGVPKVRALEVMADAENEAQHGPRGVYTGAYGFASPVAGLELAVAIRTLEVRGTRARLGVGGGVTASSTPVEEWAECLVKAAPLLRALGAAPLPPPPSGRTPDAALFETVLVRDGVVLEAADHAERLARSWWELTRRPPGPGHEAALHAAARALGPGWHRLRLDVDAAGSRTTAAPVPAPRPLAAAPGLDLVVAAVGVQGLPRHKVADRRLLDDRERSAGIGDHDAAAVLLVDPAGLVLESTRWNVLAVVAGVLRTPPLDGRILPGVTRQVVLDLADDLGVPVRIAPLPLAELRGADGVLLVNAVRGVRWAGRLGPRRWPAPDPVGTALAAALLARWQAPWDARGVRLSEFWSLVDDEFGRAHGRTLVRDHVIGTLGHRTAEQALEAGDEPREVWLALVADLEIPEERWYGRDAAGPKRRR